MTKNLALIVLLVGLSLAAAGCGRLRDRLKNDSTPTVTSSSEAEAVGTPAATETAVAATTAPERETATPDPAPTATSAAQAVASASSGCGVTHASGTTVETMTSGSVARSYRLHVPAGYDPSRPTPLVINYHGYGSNAMEQERYSGMVTESDAQGFITVAPNGTNSPQRWYIYGSWEPGYVDDFAFTRDLVDRLSAQLCIDPARIYATGISNGGGMSSLAGCELDDVFAAIAPVAGEPYSDLQCRNAGPVPIIAFHGTDDQLVPFDGGRGGRLNLPITPARDNLRDWASHNGCNLTLKTTHIAADVTLESYGGCTDNADAELYVIEGGGHTWPGAHDVLLLGQTTHSIDATALIWDFFAAHPKP